MQRHMIMFWLSLLCTSWLLLSMPLNKALASETPSPTITPTPSPTDIISYELVCTETRPEGCPMDTSNLAISWLVECGSACAPVRECNFVRHVNGSPAPISTASPTVTPTPQVTATPLPYTNCGQSLPVHDWEGAPGQCLSIKNPDDSWSSCAHTSGANRRSQLNVSYVWGGGLDGMKDIEDFVFNISPIPDIFSVTFRRCGQSEASCTLPANYITYTSGQYPDLLGMAINMDRVWGIDIRAESAPCGVFVCAPEDMPVYTLNSVRFCATGFQFPPETTPTPTPMPTATPTGTPEPEQPNCTNEVERLFRVASVPSCDVDDDLVTGWFKGNGDSLVIDLVETDMPPAGASECFDYALQHMVNLIEPRDIEFALQLDDVAYITRVRADLDVWGDGMSEDQFTVVKAQLWRNGEIVYEDVAEGMDWFYLDTIDISFPNVVADAVGFSVPGYDAMNHVDVFMIEAYGSFDLPVCGAGGVAPNDCADPRFMETGYDVPSLEMKQTSRFCRTIIPSFLSFKGIQACFNVYELPTLNLLGFSVSLTMLFHAIVAGYILRNILTR